MIGPDELEASDKTPRWLMNLGYYAFFGITIGQAIFFVVWLLGYWPEDLK